MCCRQAPAGPRVKQPASWRALDQRDNLTFLERGEKLELQVDSRVPCRCAEACITASHSCDTMVQHQWWSNEAHLQDNLCGRDV